MHILLFDNGKHDIMSNYYDALIAGLNSVSKDNWQVSSLAVTYDSTGKTPTPIEPATYEQMTRLLELDKGLAHEANQQRLEMGYPVVGLVTRELAYYVEATHIGFAEVEEPVKEGEGIPSVSVSRHGTGSPSVAKVEGLGKKKMPLIEVLNVLNETGARWPTPNEVSRFAKELGDLRSSVWVSPSSQGRWRKVEVGEKGNVVVELADETESHLILPMLDPHEDKEVTIGEVKEERQEFKVKEKQDNKRLSKGR